MQLGGERVAGDRSSPARNDRRRRCRRARGSTAAPTPPRPRQTSTLAGAWPALANRPAAAEPGRDDDPPPEPPRGGKAPPPLPAELRRLPGRRDARGPPARRSHAERTDECGRVLARRGDGPPCDLPAWGTSGSGPPPPRPRLRGTMAIYSVPWPDARAWPVAIVPAFEPFIGPRSDRARGTTDPCAIPARGEQSQAAPRPNAARPMGVTVDRASIRSSSATRKANWRRRRSAKLRRKRLMVRSFPMMATWVWDARPRREPQRLAMDAEEAIRIELRCSRKRYGGVGLGSSAQSTPRVPSERHLTGPGTRAGHREVEGRKGNACPPKKLITEVRAKHCQKYLPERTLKPITRVAWISPGCPGSSFHPPRDRAFRNASRGRHLGNGMDPPSLSVGISTVPLIEQSEEVLQGEGHRPWPFLPARGGELIAWPP